MDAAEKGRRYAKFFRKAGTLLARGRIARAVEVLQEGQAFAESMGDRLMGRRFAAEIERIRSAGEPST
jgi:hypothetical protein